MYVPRLGSVAVEGMDYGTAFYHCVVTATTVGYGDIELKKHAAGRIWGTRPYRAQGLRLLQPSAI